jgi:hypothetical protein
MAEGSGWERRKLALELRQKFEMYFVALIFTLAGLSVQTAKPTFVWWLETPGWLLLVTAGALGLWRVNDLWRAQAGIAEDVSAVERGGGGIPEWKRDQVMKLEIGVRARFKYQFGMFVIGLLSVMFARAIALAH